MGIVIKILGVGCSKCSQAENNVRVAVSQLNLDIEVIKVEDIEEIINYGILMTPGIVINEELKRTGSIPTVREVKEMIEAL